DEPVVPSIVSRVRNHVDWGTGGEAVAVAVRYRRLSQGPVWARGRGRRAASNTLHSPSQQQPGQGDEDNSRDGEDADLPGRGPRSPHQQVVQEADAVGHRDDVDEGPHRLAELVDRERES